MIAGSTVWLAWFPALFLIAVPAMDRLLRNQLGRLKRAALAIFVILLLTGLGEVMIVSSLGLGFVRTSELGEMPSQLLTSFEGIFGYNDATALCHQATENLIDGNNPYAKANIVSAMKKFHCSYDKVTPLQQGRFAEVFPYPDPEQLQHLWEEVSENPERIPPELESKLCYPAGCFLLPAPFILLGLNDLRIVYPFSFCQH